MEKKKEIIDSDIEKDKELSINMMYAVVHNNNLDIIDHSNIKDWYFYKFWDIVFEGNLYEKKEWVKHLERLEKILHEFSGRMELSKNQLMYETMFFTQLHLLTVRYELSGNDFLVSNRMMFEKGFITTKKKLRAYYIK
jgi:hypothetical protein